MNSLEPLEAAEAQPPAQVQRSFDWIEILAVPIANSIMETQPIALILMIVLPFFIGQSAITSLDEATIMLLILGLHWWAIFVRYRVEHGLNEYHTRVMHLLGLFLAFTMVLATHLGMVKDIPALIILLVLALWFWKRGMDRASKGLNDEQQVLFFKVGFVVIVVALFFSVVNTVAYNFLSSGFMDALAHALPLFFLSGLIGLSLTRLGIIRKENVRRSPGGADPTRSWLVALVSVWIVVVAAALALEIFSFQSIANVLGPLWTLLGIIANGIIFALYFVAQILTTIALFMLGIFFALLGLLFGTEPQKTRLAPSAPPPALQHPHAAPSIGLILLGIALLLALAFVLYTLQKRWHIARDDGSEEETREGLSMRSILRMRRQERQQRQRERQAALEVLDPASVRARYREFLQTLADAGGDLERRASETPEEYQRRLLLLARTRALIPAAEGNAPPDPAILAELTRAYTRERYGNKRSDQQQLEYLRRWVPHLVQRWLTRQPE
jgi:hypothetical protein